MVVGEEAEVGVDAEQLRLARQGDAGLLLELAGQGRLDRLHALDAAAGKVPARLIGMADEQDALLRVDHRRLRAQRQAARQAPVALQQLGDDRVWATAAPSLRDVLSGVPRRRQTRDVCEVVLSSPRPPARYH